jgi:hypothetical protein
VYECLYVANSLWFVVALRADLGGEDDDNSVDDQPAASGETSEGDKQPPVTDAVNDDMSKTHISGALC